MQGHQIAVLAGLGVGAIFGYSYAAKLAPYPVYSQLLGLIRGSQPAQVVAVVQTPTLAQQITGAAGAIKGVAGSVTDALSALENAFGGGSGSSAYGSDDSDSGDE